LITRPLQKRTRPTDEGVFEERHTRGVKRKIRKEKKRTGRSERVKIEQKKVLLNAPNLFTSKNPTGEEI